jgi:hypothetical protein
MAAQSLSFDARIGESSKIALEKYISTAINQSPETLAIAPVDLNNDGLSEFILKDKSCESGHAYCRFLVVSENHDAITELGDIKGYNLKVDNKMVQGVRNLLVYTSETNDYDYAIYVWEPRAGRYIMAKNE